MHTLVVLFGLVAAAVASPGAILPYAYGSYGSYVTPYAAPTTLLASRYSTPYIAAPLSYGAYGGHFIKKRSVGFPFASTYSSYIAPSYSAPLLSYRAPAFSAPLYRAPIGYSGHFIKKRSAPFAYAAPYSVSHASRFDVHSSAPALSAYSTYTATPYAYSSPLAYSNYFG